MKDNDDNLDYSGIPDMAAPFDVSKLPKWCLGNKTEAEAFDMLNMRPVQIPPMTRDQILGRLWIEANEKEKASKGARVRALELIARMQGYLGDDGQPPATDPEQTDNVTVSEAQVIAAAFHAQY